MTDSINLIFDEDGFAREYDDTYDITIHCESQEEQDKVLAKLNRRWIPCSERPPKEKDAGILKKLGTEKRSEYVLVTVEVKGERMVAQACTKDGVWDWDMKYAFPDFKVVAWMPMPEPYGGESE